MNDDNDSQIVTRPKHKPEENTQNNMEVRRNLDRPALYTDSVFIKMTDFGITLDFAQVMGPTQQNIVASIGMSKEHARSLLELLKKNLETSQG